MKTVGIVRVPVYVVTCDVMVVPYAFRKHDVRSQSNFCIPQNIPAHLALRSTGRPTLVTTVLSPTCLIFIRDSVYIDLHSLILINAVTLD